ncbi:hypothetical protein [Thermococcus zilligii]|uniref:hypothetical protein n=1 Tax=Thermococcus zilligii TaxID=54076 RepID=UPI0012FB0BD6|nr:hypothetical protein [Thermococcus zilligii]
MAKNEVPGGSVQEKGQNSCGKCNQQIPGFPEVKVGTVDLIPDPVEKKRAQ